MRGANRRQLFRRFVDGVRELLRRYWEAKYGAEPVVRLFVHDPCLCFGPVAGIQRAGLAGIALGNRQGALQHVGHRIEVVEMKVVGGGWNVDGERVKTPCADFRDGFFLDASGLGTVVHARFGGRNFRLELLPDGERARYQGENFTVDFLCYDPAGTLAGEVEGEVDLTYYHLMDRLQRAVLADPGTNWVNAGVTPG